MRSGGRDRLSDVPILLIFLLFMAGLLAVTFTLIWILS